MITTKNTFQEDINILIDKYDLSLERIAADIGVSAMTVYRWKRGLVRPKSRIIIKSLENYKNIIKKN